MNDDMRAMLKIVKKYYIMQMSQEEIAEQENISKSTVSRILAKAVNLGYVTYNLNFPMMNAESLEEELKETFNLKHVFVAAVHVDDPNMIIQDTARGLARYLNRIVVNDDIIGVSWGNSMNELAKQLIPMPAENIRVVQLNGGISRNVTSTRAEQIVDRFAKNYNGIGYILPVPAYVDSKRIVDALLEDSLIHEVFDLINRARIAVFSVGVMSADSILHKAGYFSLEQFAELRRHGFVSDICTRYFNLEGEMPPNNINDRVLGIELETLRNLEHTICISCGKNKTDGILGAIRGKFINTLFTDEITAREILTLHNKSNKGNRTARD